MRPLVAIAHWRKFEACVDRAFQLNLRARRERCDGKGARVSEGDNAGLNWVIEKTASKISQTTLSGNYYSMFILLRNIMCSVGSIQVTCAAAHRTSIIVIIVEESQVRSYTVVAYLSLFTRSVTGHAAPCPKAKYHTKQCQS